MFIKKRHRLDNEIERGILMMEKLSPDTEEYEKIFDKVERMMAIRERELKGNFKLEINLGRCVEYIVIGGVTAFLIKTEQAPDFLISRQTMNQISKFFKA